VEMVAVGVDEFGVPEAVADEGFLRFQATGLKFAIEGDGIFALEAKRGADAQLFLGDAILTIVLKHERRAAAFEPAPADLVRGVRGPFVFENEAEAVDVEAQGARHVGDHEEGDDLGDVGVWHGESVAARPRGRKEKERRMPRGIRMTVLRRERVAAKREKNVFCRYQLVKTRPRGGVVEW